jgi:MFS transporter, SP family, arabinose:H+ symporter
MHEEMEQREQHKQGYEKVGFPFAIKAGLIGSIGGLLFGYDLGVISGALPQLLTQFSLTSEQEGWVVGAMSAGCIVGAFVG